MVDRQALLGDLRRVLGDLKDDLRERCRTHLEVDAPLREEYRAARDARRTAETYEAWQEEALTQAAVAWILGCVFVRFMEDNDLVDPPRLAGPGERLQVARDHHTLYFRAVSGQRIIPAGPRELPGHRSAVDATLGDTPQQPFRTASRPANTPRGIGGGL